MTKARILVTGASGKTASLIALELVKAGYPVRAWVHRKDDRSARLAARGAELAVTDLSDVERVVQALKDLQRAYICPPFDPYMVRGAAAFAVAARKFRLEHIVGLTEWLSSPSHPALMTPQHWLADRLFAMLPGVSHTIVRPGFCADDSLILTGVAAQLGTLQWIFGDSRNAPPSNEDIAGVAVAALKDRARHAGKRYRPIGPELLGAEELVRAIGRAIRRKVRVVSTPTWLFLKSARMSGLPTDVLIGFHHYIDDHKRDAFERGAPTAAALDATNLPAEDFETIARRYAAPPRNQRTLRNRLRELAQFIAAPFSPGFNLDCYQREFRCPFPSAPRLAPESEVWDREHFAAETSRGTRTTELQEQLVAT